MAIRNVDNINLEDPYRMAGFVKFATAGLGEDGDKFQAAYKSNRESAIAELIADDFLANHLKDVIFEYIHGMSWTEPGKEPAWTGTASELLDLLRRGLVDSNVSQLPKTSANLGKVLKRMAPALRDTFGIQIDHTTKHKQRLLKITRKKI